MTNNELVNTLNIAASTENNIALQILLRVAAERIHQLSNDSETKKN